MTPNQQLAADVLLGRLSHEQAAQARALQPPYPMDLVAELTPHTLTVEQGVAARTGFDLALRTRFAEMHEAICDLPEAALRDVLLAVQMYGSVLRFELGGRVYGRQRRLAEAILTPDAGVAE